MTLSCLLELLPEDLLPLTSLLSKLHFTVLKEAFLFTNIFQEGQRTMVNELFANLSKEY